MKFIFYFLPLLLVGCGSIPSEDALVVANESYFIQSKRDENTIQREQELNSLIYGNLSKAYKNIYGPEFEDESLVWKNQKFLPDYLNNDPLIQKLIKLSESDIVRGQVESIDISPKDIEEFAALIKNNYGSNSSMRTMTSGEDAPLSGSKANSNQVKVNDTISKYLKLYYSDDAGYIDRDGISYKMPEIVTSVGNDSISAVLRIVLDGVFDSILK